MVVSVTYLQKNAFIIVIMEWAFFEKLKDQSFNAQNISSGEMANHLFETYKNYVMPHGKHMFKTASDMAMATMCLSVGLVSEVP